MTSKERVLRAIAYREVDRTPTGLFGTAGEYEDGLARYVGAENREAMYRLLGIDMWHCGAGLDFVGAQPMRDGVATDIWGQAAALPPPFSEVSSIDEVEAYLPWPRIADFNGERLAKEIAAHQEFAVVGGINSCVFHYYLWLCGQENGLMFLHLQPDVAHAIIRRITDFWVDYLTKVLELGAGRIDIIENCNDFGTQRSMFISAEMFCTFFRPTLQRLYRVTKNYGAKVMQHSCGAIAPIIPDFVAMGADILNPIQVTADGMEIAGLVEKFNGQFTFYGGIDTQYLLPQGPPERIRQEARRVLNLFGNQGGLILSGSQGLMSDIPFAHAVAMFEEVRRG